MQKHLHDAKYAFVGFSKAAAMDSSKQHQILSKGVPFVFVCADVNLLLTTVGAVVKTP